MAFSFPGTSTTKSNMFGGTTTAPAATASPFAFGATNTAAAPGTGTSLFATTTTTSTPSPFNFGAPTTTTAPATNAPLFGATGTGAAPTPFLFGAPGSTTAAANTAPKPAFTGFGAATSNPAPTFGFGTTATTAAPTGFGFGLGTTTTTAATTTPFFNFTTTQAQPQTQGFGTFPATTMTLPGQTTVVTNPTVRPDDILITSLTSPRLFNDEREELILKWNILQVFYGTGKTFCAQGVYDVDANLPYHVFKTYSYSVRPKTRDEDGLITLIFNKKLADVVKEKQKLLEDLHRLCFYNDPTCIIELEGISPLADDRTQLLIVVSKKDTTTLLVKKIKASDIVNHLQPPQPAQPTTTLMAQPQNQMKTNLESLGIVQIFARSDLTEQDYKQYLDTTPPGLTAFVWEQAKKENPKPQLLLPVPLVGVKALRDRMKSQFIEHEDQKQQLELIRQQLRAVKDQCEAFRSRMKHYQTTLLDYSHRILKATIQFEIRRRQHEPKLTSTEIQIWTNLHPLQDLAQSPLDIRVKDLIMKIRMNPTLLAPIQWSAILLSNDSLRFDREKIEQIKDILQEIHRGIKNVVELVQNDRTTLMKIEEKILQRK